MELIEKTESCVKPSSSFLLFYSLENRNEEKKRIKNRLEVEPYEVCCDNLDL